MDHAITGNMVNLLAVMKAVKRFKKTLSDKRGRFVEGILGRDSQLVAPPHSMQTKSQDTYDRKPMDKILVTAGVHRDYDVDDDMRPVPVDMEQLELYQSPEAQDDNDVQRPIDETVAHYQQRMEAVTHHPDTSQEPATHRRPPERRSRTVPVDGNAKGHAHDPLEDILFLNIGHDPDLPEDSWDPDNPFVSESPSAVEMNIYEQAYAEEMSRILERRPREPSIYMTRRVEHREDIRALNAIKDAGKYAARSAAAKWERFQDRGYSARYVGESSRTAARAAAGKFNELWLSSSAAAAESTEEGKPVSRGRREYAREYFEPWKQSAKSAASYGLDSSKLAAKSAQEKWGAFYSSRGYGASEGLSGWVSRTKSRGDPSDPATAGGEQTESPDALSTGEQTANSGPTPSVSEQTTNRVPQQPLETNVHAPEKQEKPSQPQIIPRKPVPSAAGGQRPTTPIPPAALPTTPALEETIS